MVHKLRHAVIDRRRSVQHQLRARPGGLDEAIVVGLHGGRVLRAYALFGPTPLGHIARHPARKARLFGCINEDGEICELCQSLIGEHEDALDHNNCAGVDTLDPIRTAVGCKIIHRQVCRIARAQPGQIRDQRSVSSASGWSKSWPAGSGTSQ